MLLEKVNKLSENPKQLFLIDGIGALLSAFLLGIVLVQLEPIFGIPKQTLYFLAILPCFFAAYDYYCYKKGEENIAFFLEIIAYINTLYCCISIGAAFYHEHKITAWGWTYIVLEIIIVLALAFVELKTAQELKARRPQSQS